MAKKALFDYLLKGTKLLLNFIETEIQTQKSPGCKQSIKIVNKRNVFLPSALVLQPGELRDECEDSAELTASISAI